MDLLTSTLKKYNLSDQVERDKISGEFLRNKGLKINYGDKHLICRYLRWHPKFLTPDEILKYCRGTILDLETLKPVCWTFGMREEYERFKDLVNFGDVSIYQYYDGTMVNLYYDKYNEKWSYATKGRLDAFQSKWSSDKTFGELFFEVCKIDESKLDKSHCYSFVLQHKENRIVSNISINRVVLVLVRDNTNGELVTPSVDIGTNIILPVKINGFKNYSELEEYVENLDFNNAGVIIYGKDEIRTRLMSSDYTTAANLRGNCPNKDQDILSLNQTELENYLYYYPEEVSTKNRLEGLTRSLVSQIFYYYKMVKVRKIYTEIPQHIRKLIYMVHQLYERRLLTMEMKRASITHRVVKGFFYSLPINHKLNLIYSHEKYLNSEQS